jgi:hypothetical protein
MDENKEWNILPISAHNIIKISCESILQLSGKFAP